MTASNTAFMVFSGLGLVLSLIPLRWHLESWNIGTCMYMVWTAFGCLVYFVDSILWNGNTINWAPVWCDVAIRIQIGVNIALPACSLCIIRCLHYHITRTASPTQTEKRRGMIINLLITVGIPVLQMAMEYIVAGHRFNIIEDYGCASATWNTPLAYVLVWSWPLIIGVVSAYYGALTIRAFLKRRKWFKNPVNGNVNLTYNRYWRLVALASVDFCFTIPLTIMVIVLNGSSGVSPWVSWTDTHWGYSRVYQVPRIKLDRDPVTVYSLEITRWTAVLCAFIFFGFFGFTDEARRNYRLLASAIVRSLRFTVFTTSLPTPGSCVNDRFAPSLSITPQQVSGMDSDSLSDKFSTADDKFDLEVQPRLTAKEPTNASLTSSFIGEVPRVPEPVFDPELVRRPFSPDVPTSVDPDNILDRV